MPKLWNISAIGRRLGVIVTEKFLAEMGYTPAFRMGSRPLYNAETADEVCDKFAALKGATAAHPARSCAIFEPRVVTKGPLFGVNPAAQDEWCHRTARACDHMATQYFIGRWGKQFIEIHLGEIEAMAKELYVAAVKEAWRRVPGESE